MKNKHALTIFAVAMLLYTAWRSFDYMNNNLQGVSDIVRVLISIAFLSFSEIGLIVWMHIAQPNATTDTQETVSSILIWVDFLGSMVVGLGDMLKHNTFYTINLSILDPVLFLAPWLMVVANVAGYIIFHGADSENQLDRAERRLRHEETKVEMEAREEAIRQVQANKRAMAEKLAPSYAGDIFDRVTGRTAARFERQFKQQTQSKPYNNGNNTTNGKATKFAAVPEIEESKGQENQNGNFSNPQ